MASLGNCPICFESLANGDNISLPSPCGHLIHSECFSKWEALQPSATCPTCKQPVAKCERVFVEMVKSDYMELLEKKHEALKKDLEKTKKREAEHKKSEVEHKKRRKELEETNQALFNNSVEPFLTPYLQAMKRTSTTVHLSQVFTMAEEKIGLRLADAMKQMVQELVEKSGVDCTQDAVVTAPRAQDDSNETPNTNPDITPRQTSLPAHNPGAERNWRRRRRHSL